MPVKADGDYNYEIEPAPAETFPDEAEVVAIPEEAEVISAKVNQIKKQRNPQTQSMTQISTSFRSWYKATIKFNILLTDVQRAPAKV